MEARMPPAIIGGAIAAAGAIGGSVLAGGAQKKAANAAANAEIKSAEMQVAEARAAREQMRRLLEPYVNAGSPALRGMMDLSGLSGNPAQTKAITGIEGSPIFQALAMQGEDAILQNASATGGLRGGNVQGALAQFRPALLNQQIEQQYAKYAGLAGMGQNAASGTGAAGINAAQLTGNAFGTMGSAGAGAALASGAANANLYSTIGSSLGNVLGKVNWGGGGGLSADAANTIASNPSIF